MHLKCEDENEHEQYIVAVMIGRKTGGHFSKILRKIFKVLLTLPSLIKYKVVGKRINQGARFGLDISVQEKLFGSGKAVD